MDRIGKYHVIRRAGAGGFGVVYEGYDFGLDRNVAVKVCTSDDPSELARFQREARIVSRLRHRNIAQVFESGFDAEEGLHYLVEEFLSGVDLETKLRDGDRLPPVLRVSYLRQLAQGLAFAHENGLVHRDLSPRNVRVLHDHTIKIMDFGLAKDETDNTLTLMGDNFGTIGYAAPEQLLRMRSVDLRADVFSFGVMAYELLSCRHPFPCQGPGDFLTMIEREPPRPITEPWPDCPAELAEMVHRTIAADPDDRPASFDEVIPVLKQSLQLLRDPGFPSPYASRSSFEPPSPAARLRASDAFEALRAPPSTGEVEALAAGTAIDEAFAASVTRPMPGRQRPAEPGWPRRSLAVAAMVAVVVAVGLWTGLRSPPEATPAGPTEPISPSRRFSLRAMPLDGGKGFLLRAVPPDLPLASHCYILREPAWSAGAKLRKDLDLDRREILHKDTREIRPGEVYHYQIDLADADGNVLAESHPVTVVAIGG